MRRILVYALIALVVSAIGFTGAFLLYNDAVRNTTYTTTTAEGSVSGQLYYYDELSDDRQAFVDKTLNESVTTTPTDVTITGTVVKDGTVYTITRQTNWLAFILFSASGGIAVLGGSFSISLISLTLFDWRWDAIE